jgi:hypothetical protein
MENLFRLDKTTKNILVVLLGMLIVLVIALLTIVLELTTVQTLVLSWVLTTGYAAFGILIVDPRINPVRVVEREVPVEVERQVFVDRPVYVEKEVIKEVPIQVPFETKTIQVVEKEVKVPVYKDKIVYKTKYVERKRKKLNIPKYKFLASTQTRTYHKRICKFSKLIKNKYKLHSNAKSTFKKKHYKACKACINVKRK